MVAHYIFVMGFFYSNGPVNRNNKGAIRRKLLRKYVGPPSRVSGCRRSNKFFLAKQFLQIIAIRHFSDILDFMNDEPVGFSIKETSDPKPVINAANDNGV